MVRYITPSTVWVVAGWMVCLVSLSLPWPGVALVVMLCCVVFFELASAWVGKGGTPKPPSTLEEMDDQRREPAAAAAAAAAVAAPSATTAGPVARRWSPSAALSAAFHFLAGRLPLRAGWRGGLEEVGVTADGGGGIPEAAAAPPTAGRSKSEVRSAKQTQERERSCAFLYCLRCRTTRNKGGRVLVLPFSARRVLALLSRISTSFSRKTAKEAERLNLVACRMTRHTSSRQEHRLGRQCCWFHSPYLVLTMKRTPVCFRYAAGK